MSQDQTGGQKRKLYRGVTVRINHGHTCDKGSMAFLFHMYVLYLEDLEICF